MSVLFERCHARPRNLWRSSSQCREATERPVPRWRALVYEQYEPTGKSLEWLRERGGHLTLGYAPWQTPFWRYSEGELIAAAPAGTS